MDQKTRKLGFYELEFYTDVERNRVVVKFQVINCNG